MAGLPSDLEQRLQAHGFTLVERSSGGPMGSATLLFTDGTVDISVFDDRGTTGVAVGVRGGTTYEIQVWYRVLGTRLPARVGFNDQLAWVISHIADVRDVIKRDVEVDERLREMKWAFVKERLGLSPDADQDDPRTWRRN